MSPSLTHVTALGPSKLLNNSATERLHSAPQRPSSCDQALGAMLLLPSADTCWDDSLNMQQQLAGLFRKPTGFSTMQQQQLCYNASLPQFQALDTSSFTDPHLLQQQQQQQLQNCISLASSPMANNSQLQQLHMSQHSHSLPNLNAHLSNMDASQLPVDAAAQELNRQTRLVQQAAASHYPMGRPAGSSRLPTRIPKLGTVQTYNPITGVRTFGSGAVGAAANARPLGTSTGPNGGTYLRQGQAVQPGPGASTAAQQTQANQIVSLQALVQQQQQQLGAYKMMSAFHGPDPGSAASISADQQSAILQNLMFPQHPATMTTYNPNASSHHGQQAAAGNPPGAPRGIAAAPVGFNTSYAANPRAAPVPHSSSGVSARASAGAIPDGRGASPDDAEEDLGALLHCIGTELARHNISISAATEAGWLGSVSPAANVALQEAHATEAAKMRRSCGNVPAFSVGHRSSPNSIFLSTSAPNSISLNTSLSSTIDEVSSSLEDFDHFHQSGLGSMNQGAGGGIAAVEEPLHCQITQLLAAAGDWSLGPRCYSETPGFGNQAMLGLSGTGGSSAALGDFAASIDYFQQGLGRTRSGPALSSQFANLNLGIGFS